MIKMQFDVDMSQPANDTILRLGLGTVQQVQRLLKKETHGNEFYFSSILV